MSILLALTYLIAGAFAGVLAGLFGIGGGMIIVPVLIFTFESQAFSTSVLTHMAVATSLTTIVFTSLSSVREHHLNHAIDWLVVRQMATGIVIGTAIGVIFITEVPGPMLQKLIGIFAWLLGIKMLIGWEPAGSGTRPGALGLGTAGGTIGFGSAWFGIGGGTFSVPYLTWMQFPMKQAVATSAACGIPIAMTAAVTNIISGWNHTDLPDGATGFVFWPAVIGIAITSVPFAKVGAKLAHRLDPKVLKKAFAVLLCVVGTRFLLN